MRSKWEIFHDTPTYPSDPSYYIHYTVHDPSLTSFALNPFIKTVTMKCSSNRDLKFLHGGINPNDTNACIIWLKCIIYTTFLSINRCNLGSDKVTYSFSQVPTCTFFSTSHQSEILMITYGNTFDNSYVFFLFNNLSFSIISM